MFKPKTMHVHARLLSASRPRPLALVIAALLLAGYCCLHTLLWLVPAAGQPPRGPSVSPTFAFDRLIVPRQEIVSGGVAKDGIPAITDPPTVPGSEAHFMQPSDRIAGVEIEGEARAYPLKVLTRHEVVNDKIGGVHVAVTYCPLCDSVAVFDRSTPEGVREFGVSGLLYNSNVLIYDRGGRPEGLWSQLMARGVSGPGADKPLAVLPVEATTWQDWLERHPVTTILHLTDERRQQYQRDPYRKYHASRDLMFPAKPLSDRLPLKARVLGVWTDTAAKAYPLSALVRFTEPLQQVLDGKSYKLDYNAKAKSVRVSQADEGVRWTYAYWFAWHAFHPDTDVFVPQRAARGVRARRTSAER